MIERELLLNNAVALLLLSLLAHYRPVARRMGRSGFALLLSGTVVPMLDPLYFYFTSADRIEVLIREPRFSGLYHGGLLLIAVSVLAAFLVGVGPAMRAGLWLAGGFLLNRLLLVLTPMGAPLLAPFSLARLSLPVLPGGHPPLLLLLMVALVLLEGFARLRRWVLPVAASLVGVYLLLGTLQYGIIAYRGRTLRPPEGVVHVYPEDKWLTRWFVVVETPDHYEFRRHRVHQRRFAEPQRLARWNDEALFLKLLGDPVVSRLYYRVFRHPVVRLRATESQITLLMQELQDQTPPVPGPTFYLESDLSGRNRFYQLQRF